MSRCASTVQISSSVRRPRREATTAGRTAPVVPMTHFPVPRVRAAPLRVRAAVTAGASLVGPPGTSSPSRRGEHPQGRVSDDGHGLQPSSCLWMDRSAMPQETCAVLARRSGAPPVCTESHHQLPARRTTGCASEPAERIVGAHRIGLTVAFQLTRDPPAAAPRTPDTAHHVHREPAGTQRHQPQPGEFRSIRRGCDRALRPRLSLLG